MTNTCALAIVRPVCTPGPASGPEQRLCTALEGEQQLGHRQLRQFCREQLTAMLQLAGSQAVGSEVARFTTSVKPIPAAKAASSSNSRVAFSVTPASSRRL
jgi:hypothetical protein